MQQINEVKYLECQIMQDVKHNNFSQCTCQKKDICLDVFNRKDTILFEKDKSYQIAKIEYLNNVKQALINILDILKEHNNKYYKENEQC